MHQKYSNLVKVLHEHRVESNKLWAEVREELSEDEVVFGYTIDCDMFRAASIVGFLNMPYIACKCLNDIDINLARKVKIELDKKYDENISSKFNLKEDLSQRYLHFPYIGVKRYLVLLDRYLSSLKDKNEIKIDNELLNRASIIKKIYSYDLNDINDTDLNKIIKILDTDEFSNFINNIDKGLRGSFASHLNDSLAQTKKDLDKQEGKIKVLDGQDFDLLIHTTNSTKIIGKTYDDIGFCASLIDDKNICCWNKDAIKFAFYKVGDNDISCALSEDNYSSSDRDVFSISQLPDFIDLESFKEKTRVEGHSGYNEINISCMHRLTPDAIVCFDSIKNEEKELAKKHNLDIILIGTKRYPKMIKNYKEREVKEVKKHLL